MLREIVEVDAMMRKHQRAPAPQRTPDIPSCPAHRIGRKIIEQFRDDDHVIARPGETPRHRQSDRPCTPGWGQRRRHQPGAGGRRFRGVQAKRSRSEHLAVRAIARGHFQDAAVRAGANRMTDRPSLAGFVAIRERIPRIRIGNEGPLKAIERDGSHDRIIGASHSRGRVKAAICRADMANPAGSSTIRPHCVR